WRPLLLPHRSRPPRGPSDPLLRAGPRSRHLRRPDRLGVRRPDPPTRAVRLHHRREPLGPLEVTAGTRPRRPPHSPPRPPRRAPQPPAPRSPAPAPTPAGPATPPPDRTGRTRAAGPPPGSPGLGPAPSGRCARRPAPLPPRPPPTPVPTRTSRRCP